MFVFALTTFLTLAVSPITPSLLPHHENYFATVIPPAITSAMEETRKCHYRRTNIVCNGFKESLRMNLISPQVEALSLKNNDLDVIDERIMRRLRKLTFLDIRGNRIVNLRRVLMRNTKLRWLLADSNRIGEESRYNAVLRHAFSRNRALEMVTLRNNEIRRVSSSMFDETNNQVAHLDISVNRLQRVARNTFTSLTRLTTLDLHSNLIKYLDGQAFVRNVNLEVLDLCDNFIAFVGNNARLDLTKNTKLKKLMMISNKLVKINELDLSRSEALEHLDLSYNRLRKIGARAFEKNSGLLYLNMSYNHIQNIHPHAFVGMKNLHSLDLSHNRIASLSQAIFTNLRNLQIFSLAHNRLSVLPENTFFGNGRLVALDLRGNALRTWQPATIYSNLFLQYLDLRDNQLQVDTIDYFTNDARTFDIGDWASDGHVGDGEDAAVSQKHRSLNRQVFKRLSCLRLTGNPLAQQAQQASLARRISFIAGMKTCLQASSNGVAILRCGCSARQLNYHSLEQWVDHSDIGFH